MQQLGEQIRAADGLLFATPEYNYSVSGVLKNTIDWISRLKDQPFAGKPAAICGASVMPNPEATIGKMLENWSVSNMA